MLKMRVIFIILLGNFFFISTQVFNKIEQLTVNRVVFVFMFYLIIASFFPFFSFKTENFEFLSLTTDPVVKIHH